MRIAPATRLVLVFASAVLTASPVHAGADHHMHIQSQNAVEVWDAMCEAMPDDCDDKTSVSINVSTGADAIRVLDDASLHKGVILSLAYFFGFPELAGSKFDSRDLVRAENAYVAQQVSYFPARLTGFFSVNPLSDYAIEEITYWLQHGGLTGLKLHLANSDVDLQNQDHITKLRAVFDLMNEYERPVVIHLRNLNPEYGYEDARLFIEQIAMHAPKVTIQLAHIAGWGGYDAGTDGAIQAFMDAIDNGTLDRSQVWFDIAAVVDTESPDDNADQLIARLREIGLDRVLFATDWDEVDPKSHIAELKEYLSLSDDEWTQLMSNEAPYLHR